MPDAQELILPGTEVRLIHDPGRRGVTTQNSHGQGDTLRYQVQFPDGKSFVRWYELEKVCEDDETIFTLLRKGQFGRLSDLRRNLTHIQLTGKLANLVYSMDTTNTDFYAYQFKPVLSFLDSPSNGLLIADEVGLGKTVEAGLIWTELRARYDARRLLVVCPAMLREKWKDELYTKFAVDAEILDARELLETLQSGHSAVKDGKGIICGLQSIRPPKGWDQDHQIRSPAAQLARFMEREAVKEPLFDMVIIDESHYLRNQETQSAKLGHLLRDVAENIVLLSATPVNLHEDDLYHQLNLVDPDFFSDKHVFPQVLRANEPLLRARKMVGNTRSKAKDVLEHLKRAQTHELLATNLQLADLVEHGVNKEALSTHAGRVRLMNRIERINLLAHAVSRTLKSEVHELRVVRRPQSYFIPMNHIERDAYDLVTEAIYDYAEERDLSSGFLLASPQRQVSSCLYAAVTSWARSENEDLAEQTYEDFGIELDDEAHHSPILERLRRDVLPHVRPDTLRDNDSKYDKFRTILLDYLNSYPNEKVVVFSYYPGTLIYLQERLAEDRIGSALLHGSVKETKQDVIQRFRESLSSRVLLSSEVASEGVDLQFCRVLVNYDLPWNPMKVEQRIGRIDRIGQQSDTISILSLGHSGTIDERIFKRLLERLGIFERSLGGMEAILGDLITHLTWKLLARRMTADEQEKQISQSALAVERIRHDQEDLEKKASHMIAHGGYILEQVHAAHQFKKRVTSQDLVVYVQDYLNTHAQGSQFKQVPGADLLFEIRLTAGLASKLDAFIRHMRLQGLTRLASGETIRCRFRNKLSAPERQEETISQFHPLIRFISKDLRDKDEAFYPLIAVALPRTEISDPKPAAYAFAMHRWSFSGLKDDEEIRARAVSLDTGEPLEADVSWDMINRARVTGEDWLAAGNTVAHDAIEAGIVECMDRLEADFDQIVRERDLENRDRVNFQRHSARRHLDRQRAAIQQRIDTLRQRKNERMIRLQESQLPILEEKFSAIDEKFEGRLDLKRHAFDVCFGVINVTEMR